MIKKIEQQLGIEKKSINTFWEVCPIDTETLYSSTRLAEVVYWRNIGMVWYRLCGYTQMKVQEIFQRRTHADVVVAEKKIMNALEGFNKELKKEIEKLAMIDWRFCKEDDISMNEFKSTVLLENKLFKRL